LPLFLTMRTVKVGTPDETDCTSMSVSRAALALR
jgi:hypothetical protein